MTAVAVLGYASLDHAMAVEALPGPDRTAIVRRRLSTPWPDAGGAAHVARALAADVQVDLITWVGDDPAGRRYADDLRQAGVRTTAIATTLERTPSSYLFYDRDGRAVCYFDPGGTTAGLTSTQAAVVAGCDWLCMTVGPPQATGAALDALPADASLAWVVKADGAAFAPGIVRRCLQRARVVSFSRGERTFLREQTAPEDPLALARGDALVVETRGGDGVWYRSPEGEGVIAVDRVPTGDAAGSGGTTGPGDVVGAGDTTGAGDTLAGRLVAEVIAGAAAAAAVRGAARAATHHVVRRSSGRFVEPGAVSDVDRRSVERIVDPGVGRHGEGHR